MQVLVVGAGVVGVSTALALARDGHAVTVVERSDDLATGASFANAGLVSPGHSFSWSEPGVLSMLVRSVFGKVDGFGIGRPWDPRLWPWGVRFIGQSSHARWLANSRAALRLSAYSRDLLERDVQLPPQAYGGTQAGILYLSGAGAVPSTNELDMLRDAGEPFEIVHGEQLQQLEPALGASARAMFGSAVFCPRDATGDARRYTLAAADQARALRVHILLRTTANTLLRNGRRITGVATSAGDIHADAVVIATGAASGALVRPLGYRLPIQPVTGYSVTYRSRALTRLTRGGVSTQHKIAWASFGDHEVRFTGFADVGTPGARVVEKRFHALESFAKALVPAIDAVTPERWVGQRPMTPDGIPVLGASAHEGLYLNCGHGAMGWTMASGSARVTADLISGRPTAIDTAHYRFNRF